MKFMEAEKSAGRGHGATLEDLLAMPRPMDYRGSLDMRAGSENAAGAFVWESSGLDTPTHFHDMEELICVVRGTLRVRSDDEEQHVVAGQAAWVPRGMEHRLEAHGDIHLVCVFLSPELISVPTAQLRIVALSTLERELVAHVARWQIDRADLDPEALTFFRALAALTDEWADAESPVSLPIATDPLLRDITRLTRESADTITLTEVCRQLGVSERSLRRQFAEDLGMTWRDYRQRCRILRATQLLDTGDATVLNVAHAVGFNSVSAFTRAFTDLVGESPGVYAKRRRPA